MTEANSLKWVICSPAKTGSYSIERTLISKMEIAHKWKTQNRVGTFYDGKAKERILVVRNPLDKWASMYWFMKEVHGKGRTIWMGKHTNSIENFATHWLEAVRNNPHANWTDSYSDMALKFKPSKVFKLESLKFDLEGLLGYEVELLHANKTGFKLPWKETKKELSKKNLDGIMAWAKPDLKRFNYE